MAISRPDGSLVAWSGDIDRPFDLRSSAKPFQAYVSQMSGAGLEPIQLAMAAASHRGLPVHVAIVDSVLARAGLSARDLRTPPDWPISGEAARHRVRTGERSPRRIWHKCSGKHAGFLRACVAQGWPTDTYLTPEPPAAKADRRGCLGAWRAPGRTIGGRWMWRSGSENDRPRHVTPIRTIRSRTCFR